MTVITSAGILRRMKARNRAVVLAVAMTAFLADARSIAGNAAETSKKSDKRSLYDTSADGKEQIRTALKIAKAEDKRLILKFGANW